MKNTSIVKNKKISNDKLSRKEWLLKSGKYAAFTAATMMMILEPGKASAQDSKPANPPPWP